MSRHPLKDHFHDLFVMNNRENCTIKEGCLMLFRADAFGRSFRKRRLLISERERCIQLCNWIMHSRPNLFHGNWGNLLNGERGSVFFNDGPDKLVWNLGSGSMFSMSSFLKGYYNSPNCHILN